jgi:hypothetical protein
VEFVDEDGRVLSETTREHVEGHTGGDEGDAGRRADLVVEAHAIADALACSFSSAPGHPLREGPTGDASGLHHEDLASVVEPLGKQRRLARSRGCGHDDRLAGSDRPVDFSTRRFDGKFVGDQLQAPSTHLLLPMHLLSQLPQ